MIRFALVLCAVASPLVAQDHGHSPYAGLEAREIKSLSEADIEELRRGGGWGLALPAELNGVPGPAHLLELRDEIGPRRGPDRRHRGDIPAHAGRRPRGRRPLHRRGGGPGSGVPGRNPRAGTPARPHRRGRRSARGPALSSTCPATSTCRGLLGDAQIAPLRCAARHMAPVIPALPSGGATTLRCGDVTTDVTRARPTPQGIGRCHPHDRRAAPIRQVYATNRSAFRAGLR